MLPIAPKLLGQHLRTLRYHLGWSIHQLSHHAEVSASFVDQCELGRTQHPSAWHLAQVTRSLGTTVEAALGHTPTAPVIEDLVQQNSLHEWVLLGLTLPAWERQLTVERYRQVPLSRIPLGGGH